MSQGARVILRKLGIFIGISVVVGSIIFVGWAHMIYVADVNSLRAAADGFKNDVTIVDHSTYWEITPNNLSSNCKKNVICDTSIPKYNDRGFIFYPGAKVDPKSYFYKLSDLSSGKIGKMRVFVTKPILNLAVFSINQADQVIADHPEVQRWTVGGHSLGGAMSCEYAKNNMTKIHSLILVGSYCASSIHNTSLKVILIHGSQDGLVNSDVFSKNKANLPDSAQDNLIEGMNHAQAGNYGKQAGDNDATKTDEEVKNEMMRTIQEEL